MSQLKPIEAGCMAITINCARSSNNGKFCTVIKDHGLCDTNRGRKYIWEIDVSLIGKSGKPTNYIEGKKLLRIDDPDLKEEPKAVEIELIGDLMEEAISNLNALIK